VKGEIEITKDLQNAYKHCCEENCNSRCIASMSNGDCFFDYVGDDTMNELEEAEGR